MALKELQIKAYGVALAKGFQPMLEDVPKTLLHIHSEVSEAYEAWCNGQRCTYSVEMLNTCKNEEEFVKIFNDRVRGRMEEELADVVISTMQLAESLNIDLGELVEAKIRYNHSRDYLHGKTN